MSWSIRGCKVPLISTPAGNKQPVAHNYGLITANNGHFNEMITVEICWTGSCFGDLGRQVMKVIKLMIDLFNSELSVSQHIFKCE